MIKQITLYIACSILSIGWSYAQDVAADLMKVATAYRAHPQLSMDIEVTMYETENSEGTLMGTAKVRKSNQHYFSQFMSDEMIANTRETIIIDHREKTIDYFDYAVEQPVNDLTTMNVDSLLAGCDTVMREGSYKGLHRYVFYKADAVIPKTVLLVDPNTWYINQVVYFYAPNNKHESYDMHKVHINYQRISTGAVPKKHFAITKYLKREGNKVALKSAYNHYELTVIANNSQP